MTQQKKRIVVLDCETTIKTDGNPFNSANSLCYVGLYDGTVYRDFDIEYSGKPYANNLLEIKRIIEEADLLIGFNIKFDLHWIKRYVPNIVFPRIYDCQLAEFILCNQSEPFPSLDKACTKRGLGSKLDVVNSDYWEHGIDTPAVPEDILRDYLEQDVLLTHKLYLAQGPIETPLFRLQCEDLKVLQEMEYNGMNFDRDSAVKASDLANAELEELNTKLETIAGIKLNWNSSDHLSCLLYGGTVYLPYRETYTRTLKNGTVSQKERNALKDVDLPRLVTPLKNSETQQTSKLEEKELERINKDRIEKGLKPFVRTYSVGEPILRSLKAKGKAKTLIDLFLRRAEVEKLLSTYYIGIPKTIQTYGWPSNEIHGQFNQCVVRTGRLSSSKPNQQNFAGEMKYLFTSKYDC